MKIKKDNKLLLKILSALAAIVLWFAITYTEDPIISQYLTGIDIVFEGEETLHSNGLIVTNKESLPTISVTARGNRSNVISSINNITASINVAGISSAGSNTVEVYYNYPSSSIILAKAKTREIVIETEKIVSRDIPIKISSQNAEKNTQFLIKSAQKDAFVKVRGAESTVYSISYAKAVVDATNISKTSSQEYFYKFYDENDDVVSSSNILYKSIETISVDNEVFIRKTLPVKIVLPDSLDKENVLLVKNQSLTTVEAGVPEGLDIAELYAYFDEDKKEDDGTCKLTLSVPDGCYVPEEDCTITATCELVPKVIKEIEIPVSIQTAPENMKINLEPEKIMVSLKGAEDKLSAANIKASVDASELSSGESKTLEVEFETKENITVVGAYSVTATAE